MEYKNGVYTEIVVQRHGNWLRRKPSPQIVHAMAVADNLSRGVTGREIVITALFDGKHKTNSKHYEGEAFDMRIKYYAPDEVCALFELLKTKLGNKYDVVLHTTHLHIEYDPKN